MEIEPKEPPSESLDDLGPILADYQASRTAYAVAIVSSVAYFLVGAAILAFGIEQICQGQWGYHVFRFLFFGLILLGVSVREWRRSTKLRHLRVAVFRDGIARVGYADIQTARWDEVNTLWRMVRTRAERNTGGQNLPALQFVLEMADGRKIDFDDSLQELRQLRDIAESKTLEFLFPVALEAVQGGANLGFGPISVSAEGLTHAGVTMPWSDFGNIEVSQGTVSVRSIAKPAPVYKVPISVVPNPHLLVALADNLAGHTGS